MPPTEAVARAVVCLSVEQWPEADAQAWLIALEPPVDPFSECSAASSWSEPSRVKTAKGYGRWLHWVSETGLGLDERPADRVTPQKARAYVTDLRRLNSDSTVLCRIQELYDAIRVIAPDRDWAWLRRAQNRAAGALRARTRQDGADPASGRAGGARQDADDRSRDIEVGAASRGPIPGRVDNRLPCLPFRTPFEPGNDHVGAASRPSH